MPPPITSAPAHPPALETLVEGQPVQGFLPRALYLDDDGRPIGARLVHKATGFVLDYLRIESAPQGFLWVTTFPDSDKGEPHTQEHLLLGKGSRGRFGGNYEHVNLAQSSAFTMQWRTCYHFHTVAGADAFWGVFRNQLGMLLHPDYTDEEIRREVRNFGVVRDPDGRLRLEEKGTVYNEMVRTFESPHSLAWKALSEFAYGRHHPLSYTSGGTPEALRTMTPEDIRRFHAAHYHLAGMGMIGAFPGSVPLGVVLDRTAEVLASVGDPGAAKLVTERDLPPPRPEEPAGALRVVEYPHTSKDKPSNVAFTWPAGLELDRAERLLLSFFLSAFAGDESTVLYRKLVDSRTRVLDTGATGVWSWVRPDEGHPVMIGVEEVRAADLSPQGLSDIRALIVGELEAVAALEAGSEALVAFNAAVRSRMTGWRRVRSKFLDTPPGFGNRGASAAWLEDLTDLGREPGFAKSLTDREALARVEAVLAEGGNPWTARLRRWALLGTPPYGVAARASPELRARLDAEQSARVDAELTRLTSRYGTRDPQETLRRYQADYDQESRALEEAEQRTPMPPFVAHPPMTLDDGITATVTDVDGVPMVAGTFDGMKGAMVDLRLRLDAVPEALLVYVPLLPQLLEDSGVVVDGKVIPAEVMRERLRNEILSLHPGFDTNLRTGRAELSVAAAGNDVAETHLAIAWMARVLGSPYLSEENLPRLRDVVARAAAGYQNVMLGAEEHWAQEPPGIFWREDSPLLARTASFLTMAHDAHRLKWLLADPGPDGGVTAGRFLGELAGAGAVLDRAGLAALAGALERSATPGSDAKLAWYLSAVAALPSAARPAIVAAGRDLGQLLPDLPDGSLGADWAYLSRQMAADLQVPRASVIRDLQAVLRAVLHRNLARISFVGSAQSQRALADSLKGLVATLAAAPAAPQRYGAHRLVTDRVHVRTHDRTHVRTQVRTHDRVRDEARAPAGNGEQLGGGRAGEPPELVGLVNPSTRSGIFVNSAPSATYADTSDDALLDYLASNVYAGHGAHGIFMKTWAAGLAYSNGVRGSPSSGRVMYYAERCPDLSQTLGFVVDLIRCARPDPKLVDYAVANAFVSRVAATYEQRTTALADDLADGITPERVRRFRERLLEIRGRDHLELELHRRMLAVYAPLLPGLEAVVASDPGPISGPGKAPVRFVIGPPAQLDGYERYLVGVYGPKTHLERVYPRDFWVPAPSRSPDATAP